VLVLLTPEIIATPDGNGGQPVFKRLFSLEIVQRLVDPNKGLVGHFLNPVPRHMFQHNPGHMALISVEEELKCVDIPLQDLVDNICLGEIVRCPVHFQKE
jgi:hypothetical protein